MALVSAVLKELGTMPGLTEFLASLENDRRQEFAEALLRSAYGVDSQENWLEKSELDVVIAVMQYSESIMTRFNADGDDVLSQREIEAAYPVFQEFLRDMVEKMCVTIPDAFSEDWFLLSVFREIVSTGQIPTGEMSSWGKASLIFRFVRRDYLWSLEMDRLAVVKVFSSVVAKSAESAAQRARGQQPSTCPK